MNTEELERYKKIPRHDILIYLHQNEFLGDRIKIRDIYDRLNKPNYVFYSVIDDLLRLKLIDCNKYTSKPKDNGSNFPSNLNSVEIKLTPLGEDFVESKLFGYNTQKYPDNSPLDTCKIENSTFKLASKSKQSYKDFSEKRRYRVIDQKSAYFLLTGINYKADKEKKIFISYSWDSEDHKKWIDRLANDLNANFNVEYDKNLKVGINPFTYMKHNIVSSDYVIVVFTPKYLNKVNSEKDTGVKYEFSIIEEDLFRTISIGKYLPILRDGSKKSSIPKSMQDAIYINFSDDKSYTQNLNEIIEKIKNT